VSDVERELWSSLTPEERQRRLDAAFNAGAIPQRWVSLDELRELVKKTPPATS